jgi:protein-S-isoprenylcysteine O-methyltransferase Ste14
VITVMVWALIVAIIANVVLYIACRGRRSDRWYVRQETQHNLERDYPWRKKT